MSAADVTTVREAVLARLKADDNLGNLSLEEIVANTMAGLELDPAGADHRLLIAHLVTQGLKARRCDVCRGGLVGREIGFGTCGHCGGRSIHPTQEVTA
jgi:hypothetical protein